MDSKMMRFALAVLAISLLVPTTWVRAESKFDNEHPRRHEVIHREQHQKERIKRDEKDGKITKAQAKQLDANDHAIRQQERTDAKANGGHITKAEQKQINQEENDNSQLIHDEAHPVGGPVGK